MYGVLQWFVPRSYLVKVHSKGNQRHHFRIISGIQTFDQFYQKIVQFTYCITYYWEYYPSDWPKFFNLCTMLNLAKIVSLGITCLASYEQLFSHEQCLYNWCPKTSQTRIIRYEITISSKNVSLHVLLDFANRFNLINSWWGNPQLLYPYSFGLIFLLLWWQVLVIIEGVDILHLNLLVIQFVWRCFFVSSWTRCKCSCFIYPLLLILMMGEGFKFSKSWNVMYFQEWKGTPLFQVILSEIGLQYGFSKYR